MTKNIFLPFLMLFIVACGQKQNADTFVGKHGKLSVKGTVLIDQKGDTLVMRGVSFGWHNWWSRFYNTKTVDWLNEDWNCNLIRAAIGVEPKGGYLTNPDFANQCLDSVIDAAIKNGMYVIVDWHSHGIRTDEAKEFFTRVATKYHQHPNIIYEIFNEPVRQSWEEIKEYSEEIIKTIRTIDKENIILIGSPHWDQDIHIAADNPLEGYHNIMYALHFYAGTHKQGLRDRADYALQKGLPLFVSECAAMEASGNGPIDYVSWNEWTKWMRDNHLTWVAWSVADKDETCSMIKDTTVPISGWLDKDLKTWGKIVKNELDTVVSTANFVKIRDGHFVIGDQPYYFIGTNFWYGAILGSTGQGGNRERLQQELDFMKENGIVNLRVLVGADGVAGQKVKVRPTLQTAPGVYNDTIFDGLDYLMVELEKRNMKAVLFLNNSWEWSGGYGQYLEWAGRGKAPEMGVYDWKNFVKHVAQYADCDSCHEMFLNHVKNVMYRYNRYTGKKYIDDEAIMSWQIGNEPRVFSDTGKPAFKAWLREAAALMRNIDPNHLISIGNEGFMGSEMDMQLYKDIHADPNVDYLTIHIWPKNWSWIDVLKVRESVDTAIVRTNDYINVHLAVADSLRKPLVIEEFGYPRDNHKYTLEDPVTARDRYYANIFEKIAESAAAKGSLAGCNFWSWGGFGRPKNVFWQPWDDYVGDPSQEEQGLNSIFDTDSTILL
ncbi:MAG: cellulase family glycosylhydrolase, partial [Tannerella sp.]|nr:cellulase family glycosylhydrolase [Tannerella sp.]